MLTDLHAVTIKAVAPAIEGVSMTAHEEIAMKADRWIVEQAVVVVVEQEGETIAIMTMDVQYAQAQDRCGLVSWRTCPTTSAT